MVIGGIYCDKNKVKKINKEIRKIKENFGLKATTEFKWHKVNQNKIGFYKAIIDYFFENPDLKFRCVIAPGKKRLNLERFRLTYDDFYYRIYFLLLKGIIIDIDDKYRIYMDIKDTLGYKKIIKLKEVLNNMLYAFYDEVVENIQLVRSEEIEIIQLTDLLIGAISYVNRGLYDNKSSKSELINLIMEKSSRNLKSTTYPKEAHAKFDIFRWKPQD